MSTAAAIQSLHDVNPDAVRLAESVSFAAMIDRAFLRNARLALSPPVDVGAEADLWFSGLVQSRTADGIVLHPEAADALRQRLSPRQVEDLWKRTSEEHAWLAPSLQIEERIAYLSVSKEPTASEDLAMCLRSVLAAMVSGERAGLAQWAVRALAMFPSRVQALPEARMLETGTRMRLGDAIAATSADQPMPSWMPWLAPASLGMVSLEFELRDGELEIRATTQDLPVKVPKTNPLILEIAWPGQTRQITFRDKVTVPVGSRELTLRTITGEEFDLHESGRGTSRLREAIVDFSREMQRNIEVEGREEEIEEILADQEHSTIAITGELGAGKTAFLCELIRQAERRGIPAFAHFFRFGDLRMESIDAAERSLSAQIAVRFGMDERVFDLRLAELLQRLQSQRLLIVIDDLDEARNADRALFSDALSEMFPFLPKGISVVGSSTWARITAEHVQWLQPHLRPGIPEESEHERWDSNNYGQVELESRLGSLEIPATVEGIRALFDRDPEWLSAIEAAAVALQPLPSEIMKPLHVSYPLLRSAGEDFSILNDFTRKLVIEAMGEPRTAEAHGALVRRLGDLRKIESARRYYLTNAVWHLVQAADIDAARQLAMSLDFMIAKIEQFGVRALVTDFRMLARPEHTLLTKSVMFALSGYESEIEASPHDLAAILYTALLGVEPKLELPDLPLVPDQLRTIDTKVRRPLKHDGPIRGSRLIVDADGNRMLATWSDDGTVKLWSAGSGELIDTLDVGAPVTALAAARHPYAITADARGFLQLWNLLSPPNAIRVNAHDRAIDGMLFDVTSNLVVTWAGTDPIRLWSVASETIVALGELRGHTGAIVGCDLMAAGQLLVSVSRHGTCRLWNIKSHEERGSVPVPRATGMALHWDASSRFILSGKHLIEVVQGAQNPRSIDTGHELPVTGFAVSRDGKFTATWSDDQTIRLWDVPMAAAPRHILRGHRAAITICQFEGHWLISTDAEGVAIVWHRERGEIVSRFDGHIRAIRTIEINGESIFTCGDDGVALEWNVTSGALIHDFSKPDGRIDQCVVMTGDDLPVLISDGESEIRAGGFETAFPMTRPIVATSQRDVFVCAADASASAYLSEDRTKFVDWPVPDLDDVAACAVLDDRHLAIGTRDGRMWDSRRQSEWRELGFYDVAINAVALTSDRFLVSTFVDRTLSVWDTERGERLHRLDAHRSRILALAALENFAVTGSADGTLRIWDLRTGSAQTIEAAHGGPVTGLWMEGNIVVSASLDRTVRVFDYKLAKELAVCRGHRDRITGVAMAMIDEVLYSCSDDRTIRQWDIETGEQKAIVYGTAPFRCISWRDGKLAAGDDAGNLWTVKKQERVEPRKRVYISHSRSDNELVTRLRLSLLNAGIESNTGPRLDDVFPDSAQIAMATTVVVIATSEAIKSDAVRQEVDEAIRARKPIIALTSEMNRFDMISRWPRFTSFTTVKVFDWEFIEGSVPELIAAIHSAEKRSA